MGLVGVSAALASSDSWTMACPGGGRLETLSVIQQQNQWEVRGGPPPLTMGCCLLRPTLTARPTTKSNAKSKTLRLTRTVYSNKGAAVWQSVLNHLTAAAFFDIQSIFWQLTNALDIQQHSTSPENPILLISPLEQISWTL